MYFPKFSETIKAAVFKVTLNPYHTLLQSCLVKSALKYDNFPTNTPRVFQVPSNKTSNKMSMNLNTVCVYG